MIYLITKLRNGLYFDLTGLCVTPENPEIGKDITVRLLVAEDLANDIKDIRIRTTCHNEQYLAKTKFRRHKTGGYYIYYGKIPVLSKITKIRFKIYTADKIYHCNARGVYDYNPNDYFDFKVIAGCDIPAWVNKSVFYQIFPDRFFHGLTENEYSNFEALEKKFKKLYGRREVYFGDITPKLRKWGEKPDRKSHGYEFYFGTLDGIAQKISYIKDLGANAMYLTPILKSPTNHRYDTIDYFEIDPLLGGNEGFKRFMDVMRKNGVKVILDAVYNHSGFSCDAFKKAQKGVKPYSEFYTFYDNDPQKYARWLGNGNLPKLNYGSTELKRYIYASDASASAKWLKEPYKINGYRLDVAHMMGRDGGNEGNVEILREMKKAFRDIDGDNFILAENFFDSAEMLDGTSMDSVMNYHGFTFPTLEYLSGADDRGNPNKMNVDGFFNQVMDVYSKLPQKHANVMYNQLSSHDISRHNSLLKFDIQKILMAITFQFTFPGTPSIFYGDEIGLGGLGDPECRATMEWNEKRQNLNLKAAYKALIKMRRTEICLAHGGLKFLSAEGDFICFFRKHSDSLIITCINNSPENMEFKVNAGSLFINGESLKNAGIIFDTSAFDGGKKTAIKYGKNTLTIKCAAWESAIIKI